MEILAVKLHVDEIYEYTPLQIKDAIVGYGRAEKKTSARNGKDDTWFK